MLLARPFPPIYHGYTDLIVYPGDAALLIALFAAALACLRAQRRLRLGPPLLSLPLAGVVIAGWLSIIPSQDGLGSFYHSVRLLLLAGAYLFLVNQSMGWPWIVVPVGILVATQAVVAIAQSLGQGSVGLAALGEHSLDPSWEGVSVVFAEGERILRAYGLSDHPNILGGSFALGALVLLAASVRSKESGQPWLVAATSLSLIGLLLTFSRAAALGLAVGALLLAGGVYFAFDRASLLRLLRVAAAAAFVLAPFVLYYAPALLTRAGGRGSFEANPLEQRSLIERTALNRAAGRVFTENPLGGVGIGALPIALRARFPDFPYFYQPAHFVLLDAAAETGLLGAMFYAAALLAPAFGLAAHWRRGSLSLGVLGSSAALIGIAVIGLFDYYPWLLQPGRLWQWCLWGVWAREHTRGVYV